MIKIREAITGSAILLAGISRSSAEAEQPIQQQSEITTASSPLLGTEQKNQITFKTEKELNPTGVINFQEIGPFHPDGKLENIPSDGARSLWVRPENPNVIYAGEWATVGNGMEKSTDGGKTWQTVIDKKYYNFFGGIPRDFFQHEEQVFAVTDYKLLAERSNGSWGTYNIDLPVIQTGAVLENGTILVGGMGGIRIVTDFDVDKKPYNHFTHPEKAVGLPENVFVRSIEIDEKTGRIYVGGWMDYEGIAGHHLIRAALGFG